MILGADWTDILYKAMWTKPEGVLKLKKKMAAGSLPLSMIQINNVTIEKGSITIDGTSLTVVHSGKNTFSVAIIPYTYEHTRFKTYKVGSM